MGKIRDHFKKITDTKGTFHAKMGTIEDWNGMEPDRNRKYYEEVARIHKRSIQKKKKNPDDPDNHDDVITHLEPDILECEVKLALGSITTNIGQGGNGIPVELFQILKDDAVKVLHSICQQIGKTRQWPQDWKRSVLIPTSKKGNAKEWANYCTTALISYASKVMLKILQARLQHNVNWELLMFKLDTEKAEEPEIKSPTSVGSKKKPENSRKILLIKLLMLYWLCQSLCVGHNKLENCPRWD